MDEARTEEILIKRLQAGQLKSPADLREAERIAHDRGLRKLARRASKQRRRHGTGRRSFWMFRRH